MFSAPCTMCQAFVWHLLLARQINLKILGGKKGIHERFWGSVYPCSGLYPGWNDSAFVLGGSVSSEPLKAAFPCIDLDLSTIRLWGEKIHPVLCSWQVDEGIKERSRYLARKVFNCEHLGQEVLSSSGWEHVSMCKTQCRVSAPLLFSISFTQDESKTSWRSGSARL